MTDNAKILTDSEKLNLILAKLSDMEARLAKLEARRNGGALPTPASVPDLDLWLDYRDAAKLMNRPQNYFRMHSAAGAYKRFPEIERWQPGGRRTRLYVRREHVEAWIEASRTPPTSRIHMPTTGIGYESALPTLLRLRASGTMKSLGLEQYILAMEIKKPAKKSKKGAAKRSAAAARLCCSC
jgi:hypothetical protein